MNLSIKDVPDDVAARLRARAARNHRSLQGELMAIVCSAAQDEAPAPDQARRSAADPGDRPGATAGTGGAPGSQHGWKTVDQLLAERRAGGWVPPASGTSAPLGVDIVRADRDNR